MADCPDCGEGGRPEFAVRDINRKVSQQLFSYFRCMDCGLVFLDPVPDDLARYYPDDYYGEIPRSANDILAAARTVEQYKIDLINNHCDSVRSILEIGPSMGAFLSLAKHDGYSARAIEMSRTCSDFINDTLEVPCSHAADELIALDSQKSVDAIVMWQVIEHLASPHRFLKACFSKLNPGGYLVLSTPNLDSLQFRLLGKKWVHVDAPRHVSFIPRSSMEFFLKANGFDICMSTTRDEGGKFWDKFGWIESIRNVMPGRIGRNIGKICYWLMMPFERLSGAGSCYTIIARKARENREVA